MVTEYKKEKFDASVAKAAALQAKFNGMESILEEIKKSAAIGRTCALYYTDAISKNVGTLKAELEGKGFTVTTRRDGEYLEISW